MRNTEPQKHDLDKAYDNEIMPLVADALETQKPVTVTLPIRNVHRAVGTMVSGEVARRYGGSGLPEDTLNLHFQGSAGQSLAAFASPGMTFVLEGEANDYLGKGLSGGKIVVKPQPGSDFEPANNIIVGNVALYGATSGEVFICGRAGERFAIRNSGVTAVVEGIGDHGCEYMTGGRVAVLGPTGVNFAAGMSGGIAYVLDETGLFDDRCNLGMVDLELVTDPDDELELKSMIERHVAYTGSAYGRRILDDWEAHLALLREGLPHRLQAGARQTEPGRRSRRARSGGERLAMARERGFLDTPRQDVSYRPVWERLQDFRSVDVPLTDSEIHEQASRCMDCGTPFCHGSSTGCPLGNVIPEWNEAAYNGHWREALDLLLATNVFPEFTGRICPAPCEGACVLDLIRPPVNICGIELAIIDQGFRLGLVAADPPLVRRAERVAVVGSGPAGLATAQVLNRAGYNVTVYEKDARPGGLLRYGIPDFKMEKWVVDRRIDLMADEGVEFQCGVNVGDDISCKYLRDRYDAIVLAGGAGEPRVLSVPGRELGGIHFAMEFLTQQNRLVRGEPLGDEERISAAGKNVVVIGGGDTGSDCIGTARRQGAAEVVQLEILPEPPETRSESTPWPQWPLMLRESSSHKEGVIRRWGVDTTGFTGEGGVVKQVQCVEVEWTYDQAAGRVCPRRVDGSEFSVDAELVLIAMGFVGPSPGGLVEALGIAEDPSGFIARDERHMTSVEGVFVTGDMHNGASLVVRAIGDGMQTAQKVMAHLSAKC